MSLQASRMASGAIPTLKENERTHPATSTMYCHGKMFACMELSPPFKIKIDEKGVVQSGGFDDADGALERFSAHYKEEGTSGETHYMTTGFFSPVCTYGVLNKEAQPIHELKLPFAFPPPAFLHDYSLTENYTVVVDHSQRLNPAGLVPGKLYEFMPRFKVRFGLIPRNCRNPTEVKWFDTGKPGFHWHVVNGWETADDKVILYMPLFDEYPCSMPVHIAVEPPSYLHRFELDLATGTVSGGKCESMGAMVTERCEVNRSFIGKPTTEWAYLMKRGEDSMYDGVIKYNLQTNQVDTVVEFGPKRQGGECLFIPKAGAEKEDAGYLIDIIFEGDEKAEDGIGFSELCIWDAEALTTEPIAKVAMPHRIPFGVHANWLEEAELKKQMAWF